MPNLSVSAYLSRIQYTGSREISRRMLDELQTLHLQNIPYENLDILAQKPLSFEIYDLYDKIVNRHRGGYCFELNGLYGWLLDRLGYKTNDYMARFLLNEPSIPMRRHRVIVVELNGERLLCDVGVGIEAPRITILIKEGLIQNDGFCNYRIEHEVFLGWVLYQEYKGEWKKYYSFTEEPQLPIDYVMPSFYCEKHPDSIFNKEPMISIKSTDGRRTLDGNEFRIHNKSGVSQVTASSRSEHTELLAKYFGLNLPLTSPAD